jgi:transposase
MSQGRKVMAQPQLFVETSRIYAHIPQDPFYTRLAAILDLEFVRALTQPLYAPIMGRPSLDPVVFVKCLLFGFFENIVEDQALELRLAESITARRFLGYSLEERTPDESTIRKTRQLMPEEVFHQVFSRVLQQCAAQGLVKGRALGHDSTLAAANASKQRLVHKELGCTYEEYLLAVRRQDQPDVTKDEAATADKKHHLSVCNDDWGSPTDPDARMTKMKDGHTDLAYKVNVTVDLETGVIVAAGADTAAVSDRHDLLPCVDAATAHLEALGLTPHTVVTDKGYHSGENLAGLEERALIGLLTSPRPQLGPEGFRREDFTHDAATDTLICPQGQTLHRHQTRAAAREGDRIAYRARRVACRACPHFGQCTKCPRGREVTISPYEALLQANYARTHDPLLRPLLQIRRQRGEAPFSYLKERGGLRRFMGRGLAYAQKKTLLGAIGWNLLLLLKKMERDTAVITPSSPHVAANRLLVVLVNACWAIREAIRRICATGDGDPRLENSRALAG